MALRTPQATSRHQPAAIQRGRWDCHTHIFAPAGQVPRADAGAYTPPSANRAAHAAMLKQVGVERAMLVQPSLYGTDHRVLLDALSRSDGRFVGIGSCAASTSRDALQTLRRQGIVGLRFVGMSGPGGGAYPGTQPLQVLEHLRDDMIAANLHAQIWADLDTCLAWAGAAAAGDMPVVLDHMAGITPEDQPGTDRFARLAEALASGSVWIKLSFLRRSRMPGDYADMHDIVSALAERAPDRILWGSDWPFVRLDDPPDPASLLARLREWLGEALFERCLRDNPERLLGGHKRLDAPEAHP